MTDATLRIETDNGNEFIADLRRFDIEKDMDRGTVVSEEYVCEVSTMFDVDTRETY